MPVPFSIDLCWRAIWLYLSTNHTPSSIAYLLSVSERTVWCYISLFKQTGNVQPKKRRNGPRMLMGKFEQTTPLRLVLPNPGICLQELQDELHDIFGVPVSVPAICCTLKYMGCTRQAMSRVAVQRSDILRARFMVEISIYDPALFVWLDETSCDRRHATRKYGYSVRGIPSVTRGS